MIMNEKLKAAIDFFALMIPECKIGIYSNNPLDDKRLDKIAFLSDLLNICITKEDLKEALKRHHPDVGDKDIADCAASCMEYILIKQTSFRK